MLTCRPASTHYFSCIQMKLKAMCAGIGAPGTLREILRGYFGDKKAPERFRDDDIVEAGFITIVSRFISRCADFSALFSFILFHTASVVRALELDRHLLGH